MDEKREKEILVYLNNTSVMGEWDEEILQGLSEEFELDLKNDLGFDELDIQYMFPDSVVEEQAEYSDEKIKKLKDIRNKMRKTYKNIEQTGDTWLVDKTDIIISFVFNNMEEKQKFCKQYKLNDPRNVYKASKLVELIRNGEKGKASR